MKNRTRDFLFIVNDIIINDSVQGLKRFKHHYGSTRFEHSLSVAYYSYVVCKFLHLDYISASRAGLLHDLFFYDNEIGTKPSFHLWKHPKIALLNAQKNFKLNNKECDIILKHMWPITFIPPKYIESYIISLVDKYCALFEWLNYYSFYILRCYSTYFMKIKRGISL